MLIYTVYPYAVQVSEGKFLLDNSIFSLDISPTYARDIGRSHLGFSGYMAGMQEQLPHVKNNIDMNVVFSNVDILLCDAEG